MKNQNATQNAPNATQNVVPTGRRAQRLANKAKSVATGVAPVAGSAVDSSATKAEPTATSVILGGKTMTLQLTKTKSNKGGEVYYSFGAGSIRFGKSAFAEGAVPPETLGLEVPEGIFAPAGAVRVGGGGTRVPSAEKLAKLQANAAKATARAEKAKAKADKALAAATKAKAKAGVKEEAPAVEEAATV